jgi:hypothetical protein
MKQFLVPLSCLLTGSYQSALACCNVAIGKVTAPDSLSALIISRLWAYVKPKARAMWGLLWSSEVLGQPGVVCEIVPWLSRLGL